MKGLESLKLKSKELILGEKCFHDPDIFHQNIENLSFIRIECENQITITSKFLEGCHKLKSFKIAKGDNLDRTEKIIFNERSFHDTENLEEIEIVANDINIGNSCFYSLKKLKKVDLHAKNITIGENSFEECDSIESLILTEQNDVIEKIDFAKECFSKIGNLYKIDITANDINLGINCFNNSKKLQEVTLHCKNAIINDNCFSECCSIKSFVIATLDQAGVNKIDLAKQCFFKAENLNKVELTANEINFSSNCFTGSQKLKFVVLHAKNINIGDNCFTECGSLQSFIVSEAKNIGITDKIKIEEQCFINSKNLQQIEIKANDINLGNECLKGSQKIKNVALYCKNITINDNCFTMCSIKSFKILKLDGIEFIEKINLAEKCFFNSKDLQQIEIMSNDINIGSSCFNGSKNIQKIILHCKNITIGDNCFVECPIQSFIVSETRNIGVTEKINLSEKCFFNTNNLQQIEITANDINLDSSCFSGSTNIQKIILHGKNITINDNCFTGCSIKSFVVSETRNIGITEKINLSEKCFFNTNNLQQIEITANDINLDKNCFNGSKNIQKIILHGKNITIGDNCFTSCSIESLKIMELSKNDNINKINLVKECFCNITVLKEIEIKANEIFVGENCFKEASDLQKVLISGNKVTISDSCFTNCISLDIFTVLYGTSISIGHKQFFQCNNLKTISIRFLSYGYNFILEEFNLANDCFLGADNLDKFELCGGEIIISNEILHCSSISTFAILSTESVVINSNTFNDSDNLKEIIITSNSLTINQNCFNRIPNLLSISFECFYIDIQSDCFNNIENCQSVKIKKANHITFDSNDFCDWKNLTDIEIDAINTLNIGPKCFIKSEKLKNLSFFSKNITIGTESFQNCNSLDSVNFIPKVISSSMIDISKTVTRSVQSIEVLYIGDKSFIGCSNLNKLTIMAKGEVIICDECFYGLDNLYNIIIKANTATFGKDSFHKCPGLKNAISVKVSEDDASNKRINYILTNLTKPIKTKFKNDSNFNSFFVLGINRYSKRPSYISMFPARPVTINNANIELIPSLCYPQGPKQIPFKLLNRSKIITGFVFYIDNNESVGVGVALHICISPLAKSFVGNQYDRSYPFCICLISNNPNIASHFSFLCEIVDPIIGNITLTDDPKVNIPASLRNCKGEPIRFLHVRSNSEYISLSPSCRSMNFLLPQLVQYYTSPFLKEIQNEYLLYPTLQTLISILPPRLIAELFFCLICEFRIILISENLQKLSFCILALTNLVKDIDIMTLIHPCFPNIIERKIEAPTPYIIGYYKKCSSEDVDINLDNGEFDFHKINEVYSVIQNFVNDSKIGEKVENLVNNNLDAILIPEKSQFNSNYSDFITKADKDIYRECFQSFVQTKYIISKNFVKEFSQLIEKPFFPKVESFIREFLLSDRTRKILDFVDPEYKDIFNIFSQSQTFNFIVEKIENQINNLNNQPTKSSNLPDEFPNLKLTKSHSTPNICKSKLNTFKPLSNHKFKDLL